MRVVGGSFFRKLGSVSGPVELETGPDFRSIWGVLLWTPRKAIIRGFFFGEGVSAGGRPFGPPVIFGGF